MGGSPRFGTPDKLVEEQTGPWTKYQTKPRWGTPETLVDPAKPMPWERYAQSEEASKAADNLDWADIPGQAIENVVPSVVQLAKDTVTPFLHPIDTVQGLGQLVGGVAAKAGIGNVDQSTADAVWNSLTERHGGAENIKRTMATDPAGFLSDVATILTGGAALGAKLPGAMGKVAQVAGKVGEFADPMSLAGKGVGAVTRGTGYAASEVAGLTTGTNGDVVRTMQRAGREGNVRARDQMRDKAPLSELTDEAQGGLSETISDRADQYERDMAPVKADQTPLSLRAPVRALAKANSETRHKGIVIDPKAADAVKQMRDLMKQFNAAGANTAYDYDRMKVGFNRIREGLPEGSNARRVVDNVASSIGETVAAQVPGYRAAMAGYAANSDEIGEIRKTLSVNDRATIDTQLRKILSLKRSNVNTNFRGRQQAAKPIFNRRPQLEGMIAGRLMNGLAPQGLMRAMTGSNLGLGALVLNPGTIPILAGLTASSPRVAGEAAYKIGQSRRALDTVPLSAPQRRLIRQSLTMQERAKREKKPRFGTGAKN